ncbi:uncharacterized protein DS421_19g660300 [Arachis hypogaea]|uniref:Uncharacterized protein n=1 Tax=Arachis hypogaea TaxID=3818 RepID=A0A6B9VAA0_ARAHY|nr:uncharacterized protein DS421_19g660300 [Arachis hypogaea]
MQKYIKQNTDVTLCALEMGINFLHFSTFFCSCTLLPHYSFSVREATISRICRLEWLAFLVYILSKGSQIEPKPGEFFHYLNLIADTLNGLEDRDAIARIGTRCLSAVSVHDNTLENVETLDDAQTKFDDILDSPSIDVACEKIKSLVKCPLTTIN